ncbi:hypothetical protein Lser_V15G04885 [Lactuca serriola]
MATSSSAHDQSASSSLLTIKPNQNMIIEMSPFLYDSYMLYVVECLKYSPLVLALTQVEAIPMSLLSQVYTTASYDRHKDRIFFSIHDKKTSVSKTRFCTLLGLAVDSSVISPDFITTTQIFTMIYEMGYTDVLTSIAKVKKSCLPSQWNGLLTLLIKGLAERCGGSDTTSKGFLTILYGLYNGINLDYRSIIWAQVVQSLNTTARHSEISCARFWTLITRRAIDSLDIPVMKDSMYRCVTPHSKIMADYNSRTPLPPRVLSDEQRAALEAPDQPANRGKRVSKKEKAEKKKTAPQKEKKRRSSKRKSEAEAPSQSRSKKVKKMAKRAKGSPSSESEPNAPSKTEAADPQPETTPVSSPQLPSPPVSPRIPNSPSPPKSPQITKLPSPPTSPKFSTPTQSPKQNVTSSVPTSIPQTTTEPNIPFSVSQPSSSISKPIITESVTITTTQPPVTVNVSDTGAASVVETPVINLPSSPSPSSNSGATLGGDDEDFDSIYYSPYRIPTDTDADTPASSQQLQEIHAKLDSLLADSKAYRGAVLKAFIESAIQTYTEALDRSTDAVDNSAASCSKATKEVSEVVHTTQIFLDSLKAHADSNTSKFQASVDSFSATLQGETSKFEALRADLKTESTSFLKSLDSRFASLAAESTLKEELIKHQATIDLQKIQLAQAQQEITLLQTQRAVLQSCTGDVKNMLTGVLDSHDPFLTLTIRQHLQAKLLPAITILSEMKGVSEKLVLPRQGGEEGVSKTEPKGNVASGSGKQVLVESESESDETITEALQHKKRDKELDETLKIAREAEARERKIREDEESIQAKKTLFPDWDRDTLITQAIEFPSIYWLEPIASFECENSRDSQFDMPITRKAFTFHCFDVTANVPHPNPKVDRELIDFYLKFGQPQYLTWSAQKIVKVKVLKPTQAWKFVNVNFKINRGTANTEHLISLANLPSLNPHDWILLYNILLSNQREYEPILSHLKRMLASYVHELATMDQEIAKVMNKKPTVKPTSKTGDVHKMKLGQIDSSNLTVMFTRGDKHKFLFALVDKHLFSIECLEHIINIIHRCKQNSTAYKKNFTDMLRWYITFRHHILALIPKIFETVKKPSALKRE